MLDVATELGTAIACCLLWWPVTFVATKGSLRLTYRWRPFVSGFAYSIVVLTVALCVLRAFVPADASAGHEVDPLSTSADFASLFVLPIAACVAVVFLLRRRFSPAGARPKQVAEESPQREPSMSAQRNALSFRLSPEALIGCITLLGLLAVALFPPWEVSIGGLELGNRSIFGSRTYSGFAVHIDGPLLAIQCLAIGALSGILFILAHVYRSNRRNRTSKSAPLLNQVREAAGDAIVVGYRRLAAANGCAPTQKTTDREIVELYSKVGSAFQSAAQARGEHLRAGVINRIVLKFLQVKESMGTALLDDHLSYEVEKYRLEGLRSDYQHDLPLL